MIRFATICSGIGAPECAWEGLGWEPVFNAEIEPFPSAVLAHHFPATPNLGDFTKIGNEYAGAVDLICGGTPCQSFSIAGQRAGLDDPRGNLALEFLRLAQRIKPRWIVFENVCGLLSSTSGRDFATFLRAVDECGYSGAWRVLDAQFFGVPQRRRRVFFIGYLGTDWRPSAAILLEREGLCGNIEAGKEKGEDVARALRSRANSSHREDSDNFIADTLTSGGRNPGGRRREDDSNIVIGAVSAKWAKGSVGPSGDECQNLVPVSIKHDIEPKFGVDMVPTMQAADGGSAIISVMSEYEISDLFGNQYGVGVRRLTPMECERLQGFPDRWTLVPFRGKPANDAPRYRAIGNSMAVPVLRWIGDRIQKMDELLVRNRA